MTVQNTLTTVTYVWPTDYSVGDYFTLPFRFLDEAGWAVEVLDDAGDSYSPEVFLTYGEDEDFTVSGRGLAEGQGRLTLTAAGEAKLSADDRVFVARQTARTQLTSFRSQGRFLPETHEDALDRLAMVTQEMEDEANPTSPVTFFDGTPGDVAAAGASGGSSLVARGDHQHAHGAQAGGATHAVATAGAHGFLHQDMVDPLETLTDGSNADSLHSHVGVSVSDLAPQPVGTAAAGAANTASRADHVHAHGNQAGGGLHAEATTGAAGFLGTDDFDKLQNIETGSTSTSVGDGASAGKGAEATAVGAGAEAGIRATAIGNQAVASHAGSTAIGEDATTTEEHQIALGKSGSAKKVRTWGSYQGTHLIVDTAATAVDASAGNEEIILATPPGTDDVVVTLPELTDVPFGRRYFIKNMSTTEGATVTVSTFAVGDTFVENAANKITLPFKSGVVVTKGTTKKWAILAAYGTITLN